MSTIAVRRVTAGAACALLAAILLLGPAAPASAQAAPDWAPADTATITPGVQMFTDGAQCTANFIFYDASDVYIGYAAHCAGTGGATETNGCDSGSLPLGTPVEIDGASRPGTLVYSSWLAMQAVDEQNATLCNFNDFAVVRIDPADHGSVNPSVPFWGGPAALDGDGTGTSEEVYSYGNSGLRLGLSPLSPKTGVSLGGDAAACTHPVYTVTPGIPGDSGSGFIDSGGNAFGVLSTVQIAPLAGSNGVSDLPCALSYAAGSGFSVTLAAGTEPFSPLL